MVRNTSLLLAVSLASLLSPVSLVAQDRVAGAAPGTERWIVSFHSRSFDLQPLRAARTADTAGTVVRVLESKMRADQADFVRFVERSDGTVTDQWWLINACAIEIRPDQLDEIREHPRVAGLYADRYLTPSFIKTATNAKNHRVDALHAAGIRGKGATVAILDSGLDMTMGASGRPHRTFFVNGDPNNKTGGGIGGSRVLANLRVGRQSQEDLIGHGTAVAGVAAGENWNASQTSDRGHAPLASIVGYSLPDLVNGLALVSTITTAWQRVVADKQKYGIVVANMSYEGTADPRSPEQQAIDAAGLADIVVVLSAGNQAKQSFYHGATNALAVGSVHADTRVVAAFSARGPLRNDSIREYPNVVANGVAMVMPQADDESKDRVSSGSSYAAPNVAGAAALYRSLRTGATALETRAAISATTEDVSGKNRVAPYDDANAFGHGYLRDDWLVLLARNRLPNVIANSTLTGTTNVRTFNLAVTAGRYYSAAVAFNRHKLTGFQWSNIDIEVTQGTGVVARAKNERNTNERTVWRAPVSGTATIRVIARFIEIGTVPFALVVTEALPSFERGSTATFGTGCMSATMLEPALRASGSFEIGRSYTLDLARTDPRSLAFITIALSDKQFGPIQLPFFLGNLGANCSLRTSIDAMAIGVTDAIGSLNRTLPLPNVPALIHGKLFHQALVRSPKTNALGLVFSNGVAVTIGGDAN